MSDELTASLHCLTCSPAAPPLEDDNLLAEILLRLPPLPSSLPRASAVSRRWRSIASDPRFCSRFRAHHRRNPPLLGYFIENTSNTAPNLRWRSVDSTRNTRFQPALEVPNRVPQGRFSFPVDARHFVPVGCRHGLVICLYYLRTLLLVWDPVTGDQHRLDIPPGFNTKEYIRVAVLRTARDVRYFEVVLVGPSDMKKKQVVGSIYSSKTNTWSNLTTAPVLTMHVYENMPAVMIGDSLYWLQSEDSLGILECDLGSRSLVEIPVPMEEIIPDDTAFRNIWVVMAEGGGLGLLFLSGFNAQLWKRTTNCDGVASWALQRTIALDKLLSINSGKEIEQGPVILGFVEIERGPVILGFAEDNNLVLLWTSIGVFTVQLESLQFKKLLESPDLQNTDFSQFQLYQRYYPFEGVYTADKGIDGGHDGAELLYNK